MAPFSSFVDLLTEIEDPRRAEGKLYRLPHVVLFSILAIVAGANSYRTIHSFIDVHIARLREAFGVTWRKAPAYTTIRGILRQLDPASVEAAFRRHAAVLSRCRDETRTVEVFAPGGSLSDTEFDVHVRAIIRVNRDVLTRSASTGLWRDTSETALFVSDVVLPAAQCAKAIRGHWHIENRSHYVRDGSFAEDASRIRCNPGIFARLRSFAANILRFNGIHNVSDGRHRIAFGGISAILAMRVMY